jgi:hypothetical protein
VTDSFSKLEWEYTAKGQRSAPGPHYLPAGRYTLTRDWGLAGQFMPAGTSLFLTAEEATTMTDYLKPEGG